MTEIREILQQNEAPFWKVLTESQQRQFVDNARIQTTETRQSVYEPSNAIHVMHYVVSGRVKVCRHFGDLREMIVDLVPDGKFVSFQPILQMPDQIEYADSVMASTMLQVNATLIKDLMNENAKFSLVMFEQLANRHNKVNRKLSLVHPTVLIRQQIVFLILELAESFGRQVGYEIVIEHGLSQREMASMIHRTRQSVTGILRQLKNVNIINYTRKSILVRDLDQLKRWGDGEETLNAK